MIAGALTNRADGVAIRPHARRPRVVAPPRDRRRVQEVNFDVVVAPAITDFAKEVPQPITGVRVRSIEAEVATLPVVDREGWFAVVSPDQPIAMVREGLRCLGDEQR